MRKIIYTIAFILVGFLAVAAQDIPRDTIFDESIFVEADSITFSLDEVLVFKKLKFKTTKEKRYYYWYYKKVHKAYPFAKLAAERLISLNDQLAKIRSKSKRKKHTRKMQKYMEGEFTDKLKKMTRTEGKILIKLLHRQTGLTAFNLVKEYRSGWKAFWYNSTAKIFKLSLKSEYDPETEAIDYLVEDILQRSFADGRLNEQKARLSIDYFKAATNFKDIDVVAVINNR
jgi:hypothetical protein